MTWNSHPFVPERILSPPCVPAHLRPLIKLAGNLIRNYSLKRKFCCPEQIIKCCEGAKATFIRAQKEGGGRSEDLRRGCRLIYIYSFIFSPELGKQLVCLDTEEKPPRLEKKSSNALYFGKEKQHQICPEMVFHLTTYFALLHGIIFGHWLVDNVELSRCLDFFLFPPSSISAGL